MPLTKTKLKAWLLVLTASLMPTALMADEPQLILSRFQGAEATPAPAPPAQPAEGTPLPKVATPKKAETTPVPVKQPDGVAHVRSAGCRAAGCAPNAGCGPNRVTGCNTNGRACGPNGCASDGCYAGNCYGSLQDGMICAGRPYTLGDLGADLCSVKCKTRNCLGFNKCHGGGAIHSWWCEQQFKSQCHRAYRNRAFSAWINNKFNYFKPSGCCGQGCPPIGKYSRVYAADPNYYDARDEQVYASPVTGLPTAIPLAPGVRYQYNYSWGYPGSRLTPISTFRQSRQSR
jgi:hypothetical protein